MLGRHKSSGHASWRLWTAWTAFPQAARPQAHRAQDQAWQKEKPRHELRKRKLDLSHPGLFASSHSTFFHRIT